MMRVTGGAALDGEYCEVVYRLASLMRLRLSEEEARAICADLPRITEFLSSPSRIDGLERIEPLYHVHDELWTPISGVTPRTLVDFHLLVGENRIEQGKLRVPWRGRA